MKTEIDLTTWNRKEHFFQFLDYGDPFCGITTHIDVTKLYQEAKENGHSFYFYLLHAILDAANQYAPMRMRIEENKPYQYDTVNISVTVGRNDGTYGFAYLPYFSMRETFIREAIQITEKVKASSGLCLSLFPANRETRLYFSAIPWFDFSHIKNPYPQTASDSNPRIITGRPFSSGDRMLMTFQLETHHSVMDGFQIAEYIRILSEKTSGEG